MFRPNWPKLAVCWPTYSTVFDPSMLCFEKIDPNWLFFFDKLDQIKNLLDCFRTMLAIFRPTRLKLAMLRPTRPKESCVRLCLTHASYVSTESTQTGYALTDSTKGKMCSAAFDPYELCFDRLDPNWLCFDWLVRLCSTQPCYVLNKSTQTGSFSTDSVKLKICLIVSDQC